MRDWQFCLRERDEGKSARGLEPKTLVALCSSRAPAAHHSVHFSVYNYLRISTYLLSLWLLDKDYIVDVVVTTPLCVTKEKFTI